MLLKKWWILRISMQGMSNNSNDNRSTYWSNTYLYITQQTRSCNPTIRNTTQLRDLKEETGLGWNQNWPWLKPNLTSDPNTSLYVQNALGTIHEASVETNLTPDTLSCTECTRHYLWSFGWNESNIRCTQFLAAHTECTRHNPVTTFVGWNYSQYF